MMLEFVKGLYRVHICVDVHVGRLRLHAETVEIRDAILRRRVRPGPSGFAGGLEEREPQCLQDLSRQEAADVEVSVLMHTLSQKRSVSRDVSGILERLQNQSSLSGASEMRRVRSRQMAEEETLRGAP